MSNSDDIGMLIKQINDLLQKNANNILKKEGLTATQVGLLTALVSAKGCDLTLKELEKQLHVSQPTVHGVVKRLTEKKLVECFDDPDNRRVKHVMLTERGLEQTERGRIHMNEAEELLTKNLSAEEQRGLREILMKVRDGIE